MNYKNFDDKYFLWPVRHRICPQKILSIFNASTERIETSFKKLYPSFETVFFPSGRSGLSSIMQILNIKRSDPVWCPSFSSRCVIDAISCYGNPTTSHKGIKLAIIIHQWGFPLISVQEKIDSLAIIEDSNDSLVIDESSLFPNDGRFEVFSCPKIFGTLMGGFVVCKYKDDAKLLRKMRDESNYIRGVIQFSLKMLHNYFQDEKSSSTFYDYYAGAEAMNGRVLSIITARLLEIMGQIERIITERKKILEDVLQISNDYYMYHEMNSNRLPSNLPFKIKNHMNIHKTLDQLKKIGFVTGTRYINIAEPFIPKWVNSIPIPVNHFVDINKLKLAVELITT